MPAELASLTQLQWLEINTNRLSGTVPMQLASLTMLIGLYLDNNRLSGTVPVELATLPADSRRSGTTGLAQLVYLFLFRPRGLYEQFSWFCLQLLAGLSVGGLVLIPVYILGAGEFECGQPWLRTTLAYLSGSPSSELAAAVLICVILAAQGFVIVAVRFWSPPDVRIEDAGFSGSLSWKRWLAVVLLWPVIVLALSTPAFFATLALSVPGDQNTLGLSQTMLHAFYYASAALLTFVNSVLVPAAARALVGKEAPHTVVGLIVKETHNQPPSWWYLLTGVLLGSGLVLWFFVSNATWIRGEVIVYIGAPLAVFIGIVASWGGFHWFLTRACGAKDEESGKVLEPATDNAHELAAAELRAKTQGVEGTVLVWQEDDVTKRDGDSTAPTLGLEPRPLTDYRHEMNERNKTVRQTSQDFKKARRQTYQRRLSHASHMHEAVVFEEDVGVRVEDVPVVIVPLAVQDDTTQCLPC